MNEKIMTSDKAEKILQRLKSTDRQNRKHWVPYDGPEDWDFAILNAPKGVVEEERDEKPEVGND
jgi:hypothetical protein